MADHPSQTLEQGSEGLDDRSEELSERTEADAQIRFYRAMANTELDYGTVLRRLARATADVVFDLCIVYLVDEARGVFPAAAFHPNPDALAALHRAFSSGESRAGDGLIERIIARREYYFRPRWNPRLLEPHLPAGASVDLEIDIHSLIAAPMVTTEGDCIGALLMGRHTTTAAYNETDLALIEWIASHAAMKVETARLYHSLQKTNAELDEAVKARDTFIAIAAHELRTPLSTLKLHAQMLRRFATRDPESFTPQMVVDRLGAVDRQVNRLDRLIDQLMNVSRIIDGGMTPELGPCDLSAVAYDVISRFAQALEDAGCQLTLSAPHGVHGIWDLDRLDHILTNLVSNAIKYGGGQPIEVRVSGDASGACVEVIDRGEGIAPGDRERIFERFERVISSRQTKGMGLGLWIVRSYAESLGGQVRVTSELGKGSTFILDLPLHSPAS
ncbi:HAMP domain-containing histidine kinase [Lujinxingia sediminis]|uniref:histidine kinase n=1 Tax=Lujinxingia sediminis TaxID=2480984 RepID=A0ABY0CQQ5_9DELT|nr:HAMP domain-containing sensor histidine kinase [Lujinxingia sediminis]RVU42537.1 HAMP domain-containing histidine kinase [Lujinxingia sediminis]